MATHALSGSALLIYSPPVRVWLGSDNSGTAWRADTAPQRLIQAIITPSEKHARAGKPKKKKKTYRNAKQLSAATGQRGLFHRIDFLLFANFSFCCSLKAGVVTVTSDKSLQGHVD